MFRNLDGTKNPRGLLDVLRWKLDRSPDRRRMLLLPDEPAPIVDNDGSLVRPAARPALTWIGHASYLVQLGGRSVLIDPILSSRIALLRRFVPPGLAYEALPPIDAVLVTHNHMDHMDGPTLRRLPGDPLFVVPTGLATWFRGKRRVAELGWWDHLDLDGLRIHFVPSQHWSRRGAFDENATLWGGYVLEDGTTRVYHSGDTSYFEGFHDIGAKLGPLDAAMLPIGAYEPRWFMKTQHMNPDDAVRAFRDLGAARFVAMHWGTFKLTDEPLGAPPVDLARSWEAEGLERERLSIPAVGETIWL